MAGEGSTARPINEITGIKKRSSVLVRGFSHMELAKASGAIPQHYTLDQYVEWARGPRGYSTYELWTQIPGNENKTYSEFLDFLGFTEAIQEAAVIAAVDAAKLAAEDARDQAAVSATSAKNSALTLIPYDFQHDGRFWTADIAGDPKTIADWAGAGSFVTDATHGRVLQFTAGGLVLPKGLIKPIAGRRYRIEALVFATADATVGVNYTHFEHMVVNSDFSNGGAIPGANLVAVPGFLSGEANLQVADGLVLLKQDYVAPANPPAYFRPRISVNDDAGANGVCRVVFFKVSDITEVYAAEAAAALITGGVLAHNTIIGLETANNPTTPDTHVDISPGQCRDIANTKDMVLASGLTKRLDQAWSQGNNGGLRDTGALATEQSWHLFLIMKADDSAVDVIASQNAYNPTMPVGWDKWRYIWSLPRLGTQVAAPWSTTVIPPYRQYGNECILITPVAEYANQLGNGNTPMLKAVHVPVGRKVKGQFYYELSDTGAVGRFRLHDPDLGTQVGLSYSNYGWCRTSSNERYLAGMGEERTDNLGRVYITVASATAFWALTTRGWTVLRERL